MNWKELKKNLKKDPNNKLDTKPLNDVLYDYMIEDAKDFRLEKFRDGCVKEHDDVFIELIKILSNKLAKRL